MRTPTSIPSMDQMNSSPTPSRFSPKFWLFALGALLFFANSCLYVVEQTKYAVIYTFAQIQDVVTEPGLKFKLPSPLQTVVFMDKRVLTLDSPETNAVQTSEKKNLVIDWMIKWRITDPKQFVRNNSDANPRSAEVRLSPLVQAALNEEVTKRTVKDVLSTDREKIMQGVRTRLADDAKAFGIEIVDVRIKRVDFPASVTNSVYDRMVSERKQEANRLRATGAAEGERIRAEADRKREEILASAYKDAQVVKGQGDAQSAKVYGEAFGRDPQFAKFYRSLEAYRATFNKKSDMVVVDTSSDFFKAMRGAGETGSGGKR